MENRIYFIEGLPGSGKTTLSKKIYLELCRDNKNVKLYRECEKNPLDLARYAWIDNSKLQEMLSGQKTNLELNAKISSLADVQENMVLLPFMSLYSDISTEKIARQLAKFDVYNGHLDLKKFSELHLKRWEKYANYMKKSDEISVCDGILLQSPLFELIGYFDLDINEISRYISRLIDTVRDLNPILFYIEVNNVEKNLNNICQERKTVNGKREWEQGVIRWIDNAPYCKKRNMRGHSGMNDFFKDRERIERIVIENLSIQTVRLKRNV